MSSLQNSAPAQFWQLHRKRIAAALLGLFVLFFLNPCVLIPAGHRGVVTNFGSVSDRILNEGLNVRIPIMQTVVKIDVRIQKHEISAGAASKDLQEITSTLALNYHVTPTQVNLIYQQIGDIDEVSERIIDPTVQEVVKSVTAKYTAVDLIQNRHVVTSEIEALLKERLAPYHISVDGVATKDFDFSDQFKAAIEAKQEADQLAQKAERDLQRIKTEAEQQIATARAQAESYRMQNQTLTPMMIEMEKVKKWNGQLPVYVGSGTPLFQIPAGK